MVYYKEDSFNHLSYRSEYVNSVGLLRNVDLSPSEYREMMNDPSLTAGQKFLIPCPGVCPGSKYRRCR